jgi:hypothetical protein
VKCRTMLNMMYTTHKYTSSVRGREENNEGRDGISRKK